MDELSFYDGAYTGQEIDNAIGKVRNPDITPTASSSELVTSGGVKTALTDLESDLAAIHATGTTNTTGAAIRSGTYFYLNGALVQAKADIASGATFTSGTNYAAITAGGLNNLRTAVRYTISIGTYGADYITDASNCFAYRVGGIACVVISCQIAATPTGWGGNLITGLPKPVAGWSGMGMTRTGSVLPLGINTNGQLGKATDDATSSGWYIAQFTYPTAE